MKRSTQLRIAYLSHLACIASAALFAWNLWRTRGDAYMVFGIFLFPFAVSGALALASSWGLRSKTLRLLGACTLLTAIFAYGGILGSYVGVGLIVYSGLSMALVGYGWREWRPRG